MSSKNLFRTEVSHYTTQWGGDLSKLDFFLIGHVTITKSGKNAREQDAARVGLASDG